ncbi:hypothetical protein RSPO_m00589 (plasmid) [Ralstonia solanacearum Po82]|uniref:Uncharacterized protein n=1 Tax=Ralstonia solanacearum (strain Po82) TaxID=1031711 RepID=F6G7U9_RALS8|nr:hypothetical protein RSPO_m00589 [Ralstonia solanacearum Po82]
MDFGACVQHAVVLLMASMAAVAGGRGPCSPTVFRSRADRQRVPAATPPCTCAAPSLLRKPGCAGPPSG